MAFFSWSKTAATNSTADTTINWAEGQAPSSVNDSARAMMARTAEYRDDIAGAITTGGSATAYTVTSNQVFDTLAHMANQMIGFVPHATNTNAVGVDITLNVDGLGAKSIRAQPSVALPNGSLILGTPYVVVYNNVDAVFYLQGMTNPYQIPLAGGMDYWGSTAPNTSFAFPTGQQISQTTYATLYALFGANKYGADGGGLFFLPDKTGRVSAMKEAAATRLTATYFGGNSANLGAVGGGESSTLLTANLPPYTPSGTNSGGTYSHPTTPVGGTSGGTISAWQSSADTNIALVTQPVFTGNAQGGTSTPVRTAQPTIVCNYILRII